MSHAQAGIAWSITMQTFAPNLGLTELARRTREALKAELEGAGYPKNMTFTRMFLGGLFVVFILLIAEVRDHNVIEAV
jgi:hypothetical protein